jgi:DNA ligase (NAD+)
MDQRDSEVKERIKRLNAKLEAARDGYYKRGEVTMADAEYDALEKSLADQVKASPWLAEYAPVLKTVGSDLTAQGRVRHAVPMLSIENQYTFEDVLAWYDKVQSKIATVCLEPKYDGISSSLLFENGKLIRALTRGDGEGGEDITAQVLLTEVPIKLHATLTLEIRGELVMRESTLARLNAKAAAAGRKTYSSTRNLTAGTVKLDPVKYRDKIVERGIMIRAWDVIGDDLPASRYARLVLIAESGFEPPQGVVVSNRNDVIPVLEGLLASNKTSDIRADGVVVKVDDVPTCFRLGVSSKFTNWACCFKEQNSIAETYLRAVEWQVGRTGRVTPVGIVDPVVLAGATIIHVTLNNISWIRTMGLKLGCKVELCRSGEVIPKIVRVLS